MTDMLTIRNQKKAKKPTFTRSDSHKKKRVGTVWRRPKGITNKVRLRKKSYVRNVEIGWGSPAEVKGLNRQGFREIVVENTEHLSKVTDKKKEGIVIGATVGARNKVAIIKAAQEQKIMLLNVKDPQGFIKSVEEKLSRKKADKEKKTEEKKKKGIEKEEKAKKKALEEKAEESKEELEEKVEEVEKKKQEKVEKDKVLTRKDAI